uniref:Sm domain-containing protein n=1 Tax=Clastoptera arizonana TaxID=38151 RepID=A0A1B6C6G4_9HEMI
MAQYLTQQEIHHSANGLTCLVQSLVGKYTTIDIRNESSAFGKIVEVDGYMNVMMEDVVFKDAMGGQFLFNEFLVQARYIIYVHIPTELNIMKTIENKVEMFGQIRPITVKKTGLANLYQRRMKEKQEGYLEDVRKIKESKENKQ